MVTRQYEVTIVSIGPCTCEPGCDNYLLNVSRAEALRGIEAPRGAFPHAFVYFSGERVFLRCTATKVSLTHVGGVGTVVVLGYDAEVALVPNHRSVVRQPQAVYPDPATFVSHRRPTVEQIGPPARTRGWSRPAWLRLRIGWPLRRFFPQRAEK